MWRAVHWGWEATQRAGVVTADTPAGRRFAVFGRGSIAAFPPGSVFGERWIAIGADTLIGAFVTMSAGMVPGQDLGPDPVLRIGDRCVIGRGSHIVAHQSLVIGDDVFTGPYVYITDQNHGYADPDVPIGRQLPSNAAVHRPGLLARRGRGRAAGRAHWPKRGRRGGLGGPRHRPRPVRCGGRPGPGGPPLPARRRLVAARAQRCSIAAASIASRSRPTRCASRAAVSSASASLVTAGSPRNAPRSPRRPPAGGQRSARRPRQPFQLVF